MRSSNNYRMSSYVIAPLSCGKCHPLVIYNLWVYGWEKERKKNKSNKLNYTVYQKKMSKFEILCFRQMLQPYFWKFSKRICISLHYLVCSVLYSYNFNPWPLSLRKQELKYVQNVFNFLTKLSFRCDRDITSSMLIQLLRLATRFPVCLDFIIKPWVYEK